MRVMILGIGLIGLLEGNTALWAQWYRDPDEPQYAFTTVFVGPRLCSDGSNGAFFSVSLPGGLPTEGYVGHVNRDGELSYDGQLIPADSLAIYHPGSFTLVPSQPTGSIIVTTTRVGLSNGYPYYAGLSFLRVDTNGIGGFGQVVVRDSTHRLHPKPEAYLDPAGNADVYSDDQGGLHIVLDSLQDGFSWPPSYYNHLDRSGTWRYAWPGLPLTDGDHGELAAVSPDGMGGLMVVVKWDADAPRFPGQHTVQTFRPTGDPRFQPERVVLRADLSINSRLLLDPGRILVMQDSLEGLDRRAHYLFLMDTSGTSLWEPEGRRLGPGPGVDSASFALRPDRDGGFFHSLRLPDAQWVSRRYDGDGQLIATSPPWHGKLPRWADGSGGAYMIWWTNRPDEDPDWTAIWRWGADWLPAWPDSVIAYRRHDDQTDAVNFAICEDHGLIGAVPSQYGLALFRVNPDGTLGPSTAVNFPQREPPPDFRLLDLYPNPFNGPCRVRFQVDRQVEQQLVIHDVLGREVDCRPPRWAEFGVNEWLWNPVQLASGGYYFTILKKGGSARHSSAVVRGWYIR